MNREEAEGLSIDSDMKKEFLMLFDMFQETVTYMKRVFPDFNQDMAQELQG